MPAALIPIIGAVIGAGSLGYSIYKDVNAPSAPTQPTADTSQPTPAQITQNAIQQETANRKVATQEASQLIPGLQADTSGSVSPDYYSQVSSLLSGNGSLSNSPQMQQMIAQFLGLNSGGSFGGSSPFGSYGTTGLTA